MVDIHLKHYKMLKRIETSKILKTGNLTDNEIEIIEFLIKKEFVEPIPSDEPIKEFKDFFDIKPCGYKITQEGLAQLYSFKSTFYKTRTSIILSVFSTIAAIGSTVVAIIALLKS